MLNSPLPPDVSVTERLQTVISEWKGAQEGRTLERLFQDCLDLVGADKQLLPLRIIPVKELDSEQLERALGRYRIPLEYSVGTVGRFEAALVPILRESGPAGFLFAYEEDLRVQDQVALFAHAVGHLILNHQASLKELPLPLDPDTGEIHTDRLAELRYLDISLNRNHLDRQVLDTFQKLTKLIELPEESEFALGLATQELEQLLRRHDWVNQYVRLRQVYTRGRVIPHSQQRGKRQVIDAVLRSQASLPTAVMHAQRSGEMLEEAVGRVRSAAHQLRVPFAFILTRRQEIVEMNWLNGSLSEPQIRATFPTRDELLARWLTALQLDDRQATDTLSYPYDPTQMPRYYQEAAINQAVIAALQARRGMRERRILLTLATGTGKTLVAFQLLWKLKRTRQVGNVLFLADRGYLLDQARINTFGPFRDAIVRGMGDIDTAHDILFGSYQWLMTLKDDEERYKGYPADYFDIIIIDECHRGSADENSNWRRVLEHFSQAVQIGLTATPLATGDVQTKKYFGPPVYTYTLSQGINDGFLAPYSVRRVVIEQAEQASSVASQVQLPTNEASQTQLPTIDLEQSSQTQLPDDEPEQAEQTAGPAQKSGEPVETLDQQIVMQTGHVMREYTQVIAEHLSRYLQSQGDPRTQKTIVFCVDNNHADQMRLALEQTCAAWARRGDIVRIVDDDGPEGRRSLDLFSTPRVTQPVIVTTARLLTTGVDVPTCKCIVLARGVGSLVEFKQIIGRGTRIFESKQTRKSWFTIIDYAGAIKHFSDPAFDGDPTSVQREYLLPQLPAPAPEDEHAEPDHLRVAAPLAGDLAPEDERSDPNHPRVAALLAGDLAPASPTIGAELEPSVTTAYEEHAATFVEQPESLTGSGSPAAHEMPDPAYTAETPLPAEAESVIPGTENVEPAVPAHEQSNGTPFAPAQSEQLEERDDADRQMHQDAKTAAKPTQPDRQPAPGLSRADEDTRSSAEPQPTPAAPEPAGRVVELAGGRRFFIVKGEFPYELDASGARLRPGTNSDFAQEALQEMVQSPDDLRRYWSDSQQRALLIDQLTKQIVALDALAEALKLPEVDHYDLLRYVLFQLPTMTRAERVARLRAAHSTFFQRFEHNPLANELLNAILEKYIQGDAPDVSNVALLSVPPLSARTRMEWAQAFSQGTPKTSITAVLKELQQLLYSV